MLPLYVRRARTVDAVLPWLYLTGVSTGNMREAMTALLREQAPGLSTLVISRLKANWTKEYEAWRKRLLGKKRWAYLWADGICSSRGAEETRVCQLVIIGVNERGPKRFLAIEDGVRESTASWRAVLSDLKCRGLKVAPKLAVGDGAIGFGGALAEVTPA